MNGPCILALDPGHNLGYAVDDPAAANGCRAGVCKVPSHHPQTGKEFCFVETWLMAMVGQYGVKVLVWEAPIPIGGSEGSRSIPINQHTIEFTYGLSGVLDLVGTRLGCTCWKASLGTVRKHFTGKGNVDKGVVYQRALAVGYDVSDLNASDAVAIWDFSKHKYRAPGVIAAGPLFADPLRSMRREAPELEE